MRFSFLILTTAVLFSGCSSATPEEISADSEPARAEPFTFVSDPALKELMATKVETLSVTLWNANLEEKAPKRAEDWKALETAATELIEAVKRMMVPPLAKDEGKWKQESQRLVDLSETALKAIQNKNLAALNDATNKITVEGCTDCHKLYYTGPEN